MSFILEDGMMVIAGGNLTVYEKQGKYQLDTETIHPIGIGELQLAFEKLKKKLSSEGLFDDVHKKQITCFPFRIGIVTSPTGAAIQDIRSVIGRRFPQVQLILNPVRVQGDGAAEEICEAIKEFNEYGEVDLIIVGRGGGSLEDLWAFNEEIIARAIFDSQVPIISAVGHEIDFSIADFVADKRAPTPSAAGEIAVQNKEELDLYINELFKKVYSNLKNKIESERKRIGALESSYYFRKPLDLYKQYSQAIDEITHRLEISYKHIISLLKEIIIKQEVRLKSLDPHSVLKRGYSICYKLPDEEIIKSSKKLKVEDKINIRFYEGGAEGEIRELIE